MSKQGNSKKISTIISQLREIQIEDSESNESYLKNEFKCLVGLLESQVGEAQYLYDNMKEEGLKFSTIEAEGYLRGLKVAFNSVKDACEAALNDCCSN